MSKNKKKKKERKELVDSWKNSTTNTPALPTIYIDFMAKNKLDLYIGCCDEEISGLGKVEKVNGKFFIKDIILLPQEVTSSSTDLDEKALDEFTLEMIEKGESLLNYKLWWHSHVNMSTFWSGTDTGTIEKFRNGWFLSIVGNKSGSYKTRLDLFDPFRYHFDDLDLSVIVPPIPEMKEMIEAEIKEKVKRKVYSPTTWGSGCTRSWDFETKCWTEERIDPVTKQKVKVPISVNEWRKGHGYFDNDDEKGYGMTF